ncbi:MAG TPA: hypothetical protein VNS34_13755 [Rhizobiaceae bacterium]|nr:hypothetical protein [Rhizobiaceae bacterium]
MPDICLILDVDAATIKALDKLVAEAELASRRQAATSIVRNWLLATGYLDDDKPLTFPPERNDDRS